MTKIGLAALMLATAAWPRAAHADDATVLAAACSAAPVAAPSLAPDAWPLRVRTDAPLVQAAACAALRADGGTAAPLRVWIAETLHLQSHSEDAERLLQTLAPEDGGPREPPWRAHWYIVAGTIAHDAGLGDVSQRHFERAQHWLVQEGLTNSRLQAIVWTGEGLALQAARRLPAAAAAAERARALLVAIGAERSLEMSDVHNLLAVIAAGRGRREEAVAHSLAEIEVYRQLGRADDPELIDSYATIGSELSQLGRYDEADAALRAGVALIEAHPRASPNGQVGVYGNLAANELARGALEPALQHAERALATAARFFGAGSPNALHPTLMHATANIQLGRFGAAAADYERAQAIAERHRAALGLVRLLRVIEGRAQLLLKLGDVDAALTLAEDGAALADADPQLAEWQGRMAKLRARCELRAERAAAAVPLYARAVTLLGSVNGATNPFVLALAAEECEARLRAGADLARCAGLAAALPQLDTAAPAYRFAVRSALAHLALQRGDREDALAQRLAALAAAYAGGSADPLWIALDELALQLRADGRRDLADYFGKEAVSAIEALRGEVGRADESSFLRDKVPVYRRVADWLAADGRPAEALVLLRLLKAQEFDDFTRGDAAVRSRARAGTRSDAPLTGAEEALRARWRATLGTLPQAGQGSVGAEAGWARQAVPLLEQMQAELARSAPAPAATALRPLPPADTVEVHAIAAPTLTLIVRSAEGERRIVLARDRDAAGREIGRLLAALSSGEDAQPLLQSMYGWLGAPVDEIARAAKARRLALYMDGALRYVPFAALHDGRQALGERYAIESFVATALPQPLAPAVGPERIAAFGVTREVARMKALRGVDEEVCSIVAGPVHGLGPGLTACRADGRGRGFVPGEAWLNEQFTSARLLASAPAAGTPRAVLHIGTHFSLRPGDMGRSWLLLGDGTRLPLGDLAQLSFERDQLVVLSACETGLGGGTGADGREVEGFNMLVVRRGAHAVLASLWPVDDASTGALMQAFYRELGRRDPAEALRRAQAAVRAQPRWAAPRFWAGFYLTRGAGAD